jgi:hypothetical protein
MEIQRIKCLRVLGIALLMLITWSGAGRAQTWQPLVNEPNLMDGAGTALLLTDGTVMVQDNGSFDWWRLTPDVYGSYVNGAWSQLASFPSDYAPLYFSSAVLPDGRVMVEGGEYNDVFGAQGDTTLGFIYDPRLNTWTPVPPPAGWSSIGDAPNVVLPNGQFLLGSCCSGNAEGLQDALLNAASLAWTATGTNKADSNNEEGWTLLRDGTVLTVDTNNTSNLTHAEKYIPSTGQWVSAGSTIVKLDDTNPDGSGSHEMGPTVLRPDGTVFAIGATGHTAIYTPAAVPTGPGTWAVGPDFPDVTGEGQLDVADGPASLLPDGNVLVAASPGIYNPPTEFFEFDGQHLLQVPAVPGAYFQPSFYGRMLLLPTGQVLYTDYSNDVELYTAAGSANPAWAPAITSCPTTLVPNNTYRISGTQFNGLSQADAYGDDAQEATNYPLVRITNQATGHVFYARTHDHSTMAVATGHALVSTYFDVPPNLEQGASDLAVVANGIPSLPFRVFSPGSPSLSGRILSQSASGTIVTLHLQIANSGTGDARDIQLAQLGLRTLTGTGTGIFLGRFPLHIGNLPAGAAVTVSLGFSVPSTITKFSLTENGTLQNTIGGVYNYSIAQVVYASR